MATKLEKINAFLALATDEEKLLIMEIWERKRLDGAWKQMQLIRLHRTATEEEKQLMLEAREKARLNARMEAWKKVRFHMFNNDKAFRTVHQKTWSRY